MGDGVVKSDHEKEKERKKMFLTVIKLWVKFLQIHIFFEIFLLFFKAIFKVVRGGGSHCLTV